MRILSLLKNYFISFQHSVPLGCDTGNRHTFYSALQLPLPHKHFPFQAATIVCAIVQGQAKWHISSYSMVLNGFVMNNHQSYTCDYYVRPYIHLGTTLLMAFHLIYASNCVRMYFSSVYELRIHPHIQDKRDCTFFHQAHCGYNKLFSDEMLADIGELWHLAEMPQTLS